MRARFANLRSCCANGRKSWRPACAPSGSVRSPTEAYFFLADFAPHDAGRLAKQLEELGIVVKPVNDARLGPGFMRVTTVLPEDKTRFLPTMRELL